MVARRPQWHFEIYNAERGCFAKCRMVLQKLLEIDEPDRARMLLGQLTSLFLSRDITAAVAVHRQDIADSREDLTQADVVRTPDWIHQLLPDELRQWENNLRAQAESSVTLADLIRSELESRKGAAR